MIAICHEEPMALFCGKRCGKWRGPVLNDGDGSQFPGYRIHFSETKGSQVSPW